MQKKGISSLWQCQIFWFEFIQTDKSSTFLGTNILLIFILQSCSKIWPNPQRLWILRLRLKFSCMMELSDYPLDRQICGMQISSCKPHLTNKINYTKQQSLLIINSPSVKTGTLIIVALYLRIYPLINCVGWGPNKAQIGAMANTTTNRPHNTEESSLIIRED